MCVFKIRYVFLHINKLLKVRLLGMRGKIPSINCLTCAWMRMECADGFRNLAETKLFIIFAVWELLFTTYWPRSLFWWLV